MSVPHLAEFVIAEAMGHKKVPALEIARGRVKLAVVQAPGGESTLWLSLPGNEYRAVVSRDGLQVTYKGVHRRYGWEALPDRIEVGFGYRINAKYEAYASVARFDLGGQDESNPWKSLLAPGILVFAIWTAAIRYREAVRNQEGGTLAASDGQRESIAAGSASNAAG